MSTNYNEWMTLYNSTPLKKLSIPGSHDAGMYKITWSTNLGDIFPSDNAQTQSKTILEQLEAGIRYFDLRPGRVIDPYGVETYYVGHFAQSDLGTVGSTGATLAEIMADVLSFLNKCGSNEVIILKFSHYFQVTHQGGIDNTLWDDEHHDSVFTPIKQCLVNYVAKTLSPSIDGKTTNWLFDKSGTSKRIAEYTPGEITQISDTKPPVYQARVVAVFDKIPTVANPSTASPSVVIMPSGTYYYADMVADSGKEPDTVKVAPDLPTGDFVLYDCYSNTDDYDTMSSSTDSKGQLTKFNTISFHSGDLYLLSWTLTLKNVGHVFNKIADLAETANSHLRSVIESMINTNQIYCNVDADDSSKDIYMIPNIIYVDYSDTFVTDVCIGVNDQLVNLSPWYGSLQNNANSQYRCNHAKSLESTYSSPNCLINFQLQIDGTYALKNMGNNQYYQSSIGTMVDSIAGANQKWNLIHISGNQYYVQNVGNQQYMTRNASQLSDSSGVDEVWNIEDRPTT